jgi:iron complex transport system substrate-binding protein
VVALLAVSAACSGDDSGGGTATATPTSGAQGQIFSCDQPPVATQPDATPFPLQLRDDSGRSVAIKAPPQAIASLSAGATEVLYAIGAGGQIAAVDKTSDCPASTATLPKTDAFNPSVESISALKPDLVVLFYDPGDLVTSLQGAGLTTILLNTPSSIDQVFQQAALLGQATGHASEASKLVDRMKSRIDAIKKTIPSTVTHPSVYHEIDNTYFTAGPGSFIDDLYQVLGARNIAASTGEAFPQLSQESIIAANPDVIVLADEDAGETPAKVQARAGWSSISAVQADRIYTIDPDIVSRPGPRLIDALEMLEEDLYPQGGRQ